MRIHDVVVLANGRWPSVFERLGINMPKRGKHGPCPICGDGIDRLHFDDLEGRGTWHCRKCEGKRAGDGLSMVMRSMGVSAPVAAEMVMGALGARTK